MDDGAAAAASDVAPLLLDLDSSVRTAAMRAVGAICDEKDPFDATVTQLAAILRQHARPFSAIRREVDQEVTTSDDRDRPENLNQKLDDANLHSELTALEWAAARLESSSMARR